jgi:hypothetical protein
MKQEQNTYILHSQDFSSLVIAKNILKTNQKAKISIFLGIPKEKIPSKYKLTKLSTGVTKKYTAVLATKSSLYSIDNKKVFSASVLPSFANEGIADSIEMRRIARKIFRTIKNHHHTTLLVQDIILGEQKTRKVLQAIAGKKLSLIFTADFIHFPSTESQSKREINIFAAHNQHFVHTMAQKILQEKIAQTSIQNIPTIQ